MRNKKITKNILSALVICALLFALSSCGGLASGVSPTPKSKTVYGYFDSFITVMDYSGSSEDEFNSLCRRISDEAAQYHSLFDIYKSHEGVVGIKAINDNAGGEALAVSTILIDFLEYCKQVYTFTQGKTNVAMGSVLSIWHEYREKGVSLPDQELLLEASEHTDIDSLVIDRAAGTVRLCDPDSRLDVGAVAKGYAAARIAEGLNRDGYSSVVLDFGGNLCAIGTKPNGDGWTTGIKNPLSPYSANYLVTFKIQNASVATSGNYERYYEVDGVRYHHIISPDTLMPSDYHSSVTVVSRDAGLSDALSTALFCMTIEEGREVVKSLAPDIINVYWISPAGDLISYKD